MGWLGIRANKFSRWCGRLGTPNQHNAASPRDFWLEDWEKAAILAFHDRYPFVGYRRLAYMMLDVDVVAVRPITVYRVLKEAGKLSPRGVTPSKKGLSTKQPPRPHKTWHIDVSKINVCGTIFFLCTIFDDYSQFIVHCEVRETMSRREVKMIVQRVGEQHPEESPLESPSKGTMKRWYETLKGECVRADAPFSLDDARRLFDEFVRYSNTIYLHSAIGFVTPADKLAGRAEAIFAARRQKLTMADARRRAKTKLKEMDQPKCSKLDPDCLAGE